MKTTNASSGNASTFELARAGQSPWLDFISRQLLSSGKLKSLIEDAGLLGVTSNPSIFEKAIGTPGAGYDKDVKRLSRKGQSTLEIYDALTIEDIQEACDLFKGVHTESEGEHGYVSLEVRPDLAHDEKRTVEDAVRLFGRVARPNVMIKVPATTAGVAAFRELTARGINVNVTLIFSLEHYLSVLNAYLEGLEERLRKGADLSKVHSVASVFVSRYDSLLDVRLAQLQERESDADERADLESLKGKAAVANSKIIYQEFRKVLAGGRFQTLKANGANVQKVLWGSTSVKNPKYPDLLYVEPLIGEETVNTMPEPTFTAFLDHGQVKIGAVEENVEEAAAVVDRLKEWGLDLNEVGQKLQHDGLIAFENSFDSLMKTLELACEHFRGKTTLARLKATVSEIVTRKVPVERMEKESFRERFFKADPSLWKTEKEHQQVINNRMGWLRIADWMLGRLYELDELSDDVWNEHYHDLVLLGMGGSSLAPEVMSLIVPRLGRGKKMRFHVLDTTDPGALLAVERKVKLQKTLFIVASKSGSTVETMSQYQYFHEKVLKQYAGNPDKLSLSGNQFIAITDEGSRLEQEGYDKRFRKVFINPTDVGGRYSALSFFGLVPAALLGISVRQLLKQAKTLFASAESEKDLRKNASFYLGALLGTLAREGRGKLTVWTSPRLKPFGAWLEQLVAESTGKEGQGILPVDGERPGKTDVYGKDRSFLILKLAGEKNKRLAAQVKELKKAGFPVLEMDWPDRTSLGAEFLRWEISTAVASAVMGVNPFDEPNVKESKDITTRLLTESERDGEIVDPENLVKARKPIDFDDFFRSLEEGRYLALLPYVMRSPKTTAYFERIQAVLRDAFKVPVTVGFGPRYLHSIGQLFKGGPETGNFLFFTLQDPRDAKIPHVKFSFSDLKKAQATGDSQALSDRGLPAMTVDLGRDLEGGLKAFEKQLVRYLKQKNPAS
ncbi:MAG TPA: bifunctional transaldolase/phosoglucose isomerase [Verrucomicrobiae bacterium]|nr:bifunctional transaldolase/phosoglucose isomerase [Verrucomicrobiae bacterium]